MKLQKETNVHGRWYGDACGAAFAMELIGERWTLLIVRELMLGGRRFSDIRASLPGLSARVLTERLERLEDLSITRRRTLPPPAASQVYELTPWGLGLEDVMQALGRWAVRSPLHDPTLPLTPVAFLLSLRTMVCPLRAGDLSVCAQFVLPEENLLARLEDGELTVARGVGADTPHDIAFRAEAILGFLALIYGKQPARECGVTITGDAALAQRFIDLFALPSKLDSAPER